MEDGKEKVNVSLVALGNPLLDMAILVQDDSLVNYRQKIPNL